MGCVASGLSAAEAPGAPGAPTNAALPPPTLLGALPHGPRLRRGRTGDDTSTRIWSPDGLKLAADQAWSRPTRTTTSLSNTSTSTGGTQGVRKIPSATGSDENEAMSSVSAEPWQLSGRLFAEHLRGFNPAPTNFRARDFRFHSEGEGEGEVGPSGWTIDVEALGFAVRALVAPALGAAAQEGAALHGRLSATRPVALTEQERRALDLAPDATLCAFSHPVQNMPAARVAPDDGAYADVSLLAFGGYMFFDDSMALKDVRAVAPSDAGSIKVGPPRRWQADWTPTLAEDRWQPVATPALRASGARYFAWLQPDEAIEDMRIGRMGGLAYIFHEPSEPRVLQAQLDIYFAFEGPKVGRGCPSCSRALQWSDFAGGCYENGWDCDNMEQCGQSAACSGKSRWHCTMCSVDLCHACFRDLPKHGKS